MEPTPPRASIDEKSKHRRDSSRSSSLNDVARPVPPVPNKQQPLGRQCSSPTALPAKSKNTDPDPLTTPAQSAVSTDSNARDSSAQRHSRHSTGQHYHHRHDRRESGSSISSWSDAAPGFSDSGPARFPTAPNSIEIYDSLEREQEAIVNKLQREISVLKGEKARSRSQSTSSTSSISRRPSTRSVYSSSDTEDVHTAGTMLIPPSPLVAQRSTRASFGSSSGDDPMLASLKRENETLKKRLAELSQKLTEREKEVDALKSKLEHTVLV